jgi:hypothetical protein
LTPPGAFTLRPLSPPSLSPQNPCQSITFINSPSKTRPSKTPKFTSKTPDFLAAARTNGGFGARIVAQASAPAGCGGVSPPVPARHQDGCEPHGVTSGLPVLWSNVAEDGWPDVWGSCNVIAAQPRRHNHQSRRPQAKINTNQSESSPISHFCEKNNRSKNRIKTLKSLAIFQIQAALRAIKTRQKRMVMMTVNSKSGALKAQNYSIRGLRPRTLIIEIYAPCKGAPNNHQFAAFWIAHTGQNNLWGVLPRALPSATMDQAVGLDHGLSPIAPLQTSNSLSFNMTPRHFSTFPSQKMKGAHTKNSLYLRGFDDGSLKSDLSQIKVNSHQKISRFFSGRLLGNHWEIRPKAAKKPCKISQKNALFWCVFFVSICQNIARGAAIFSWRPRLLNHNLPAK